MVSSVDNLNHNPAVEAPKVPFEAQSADLYRSYLKSAEGRDVHNIAAMLHLVQFLLSQLHKIQDSVVKEKSKSSEYWTKQSEKSSEAKEFAGQLKMLETFAPALSMAVPMVVNATNFPNHSAADLKKLQNQVSEMGSTGIKTLTNAVGQNYESESNERMQHSQMHQGDKDTAQNTLQGLTQSLQAVIDGLRNALNTLGNQNKDASGR